MISLTKKQLANQYGVNSQTLRRWIRRIPELDTGRRNYLTPAEIEILYKHLGKP